jgi:flagellar basal-body rod protein FlgB
MFTRSSTIIFEEDRRMNLFPASFKSLEGALNTASLKQRTISNNIANVDTPHYKSKEVVFQAELKKAMDQNKGLKSYRTNALHIPFRNQLDSGIPQGRVITQTGTLFNHNGNNVDMDYEMAEMAKNQLWYSALIERANGRFGSLRKAITE